MAADLFANIPDIDCFLGNARVIEILQRAINRDRLPHAMIFAGPSGVGKKTLAILLAQMVNCLEGPGIRYCGKCKSCLKIRSGSHPDVRVIGPEGAVIKIDQARDLINEIAYQPFEARYRVVIFDPADQFNLAAANSLLKTLEEPPSRTILILVTTSPHLLLETIRSRARILQFGAIPLEQIEDYLIRTAGRSPEDARLQALLCEGSLSTALAFDSSEYRNVRAQALRFTQSLLAGDSFAEFSALSASLAKQKDSFRVWIDAVLLILQDAYYAKIAPERMGQKDIREDLKSLTRSTTRMEVLDVLNGMKRLKKALRININRQLALEALFLQNRAAHPRQAG